MEELLQSYCDGLATADVLDLVEDFCYTEKYQHTATKQFILHNDLGKAIENHLWDLAHPDRYFDKITPGQRTVLGQIQMALISIGYKRLLHERTSSLRTGD